MNIIRTCKYCGDPVRKWAQSCWTCKQRRLKERKRRDYLANRDAYITRANRWRALNPERTRANRRRWLKAHPGVKLQRVLRRHGLLRKKAA